MEATPTNSADRPDGGIWHIRLEADPGKHFRFVTESGQGIGDTSGRVMWAGDVGEIHIPYGVSAHLPHQPDHTLLDITFPPDHQLPNVRSNGGYLLHLVTPDGYTETGGYSFEEFVPPATQQEA